MKTLAAMFLALFAGKGLVRDDRKHPRYGAVPVAWMRMKGKGIHHAPR